MEQLVTPARSHQGPTLGSDQINQVKSGQKVTITSPSDVPPQITPTEVPTVSRFNNGTNIHVTPQPVAYPSHSTNRSHVSSSPAYFDVSTASLATDDRGLHPKKGETVDGQPYSIVVSGDSDVLTPLQKLYKDRSDLVVYLQAYREEVAARERQVKDVFLRMADQLRSAQEDAKLANEREGKLRDVCKALLLDKASSHGKTKAEEQFWALVAGDDDRSRGSQGNRNGQSVADVMITSKPPPTYKNKMVPSQLIDHSRTCMSIPYLLLSLPPPSPPTTTMVFNFHDLPSYLN